MAAVFWAHLGVKNHPPSWKTRSAMPGQADDGGIGREKCSVSG
jgi:hypothetical protein